MLSIVLSASSLLPPSAGRSALGSGALSRSAVRTPTMTLMTDMQAQMELLQRELDVAKAALLSVQQAKEEGGELPGEGETSAEAKAAAFEDMVHESVGPLTS